MNAKLNQQLLEDARNTLAEYTKWLETAEFINLPPAVHRVLARGKNSLVDSIIFYEKLTDEHVEEEYLHFSDEDFLVDDIGLEELEHA